MVTPLLGFIGVIGPQEPVCQRAFYLPYCVVFSYSWFAIHCRTTPFLYLTYRPTFVNFGPPPRHRQISMVRGLRPSHWANSRPSINTSSSSGFSAVPTALIFVSIMIFPFLTDMILCHQLMAWFTCLSWSTIACGCLSCRGGVKKEIARRQKDQCRHGISPVAAISLLLYASDLPDPPS